MWNLPILTDILPQVKRWVVMRQSRQYGYSTRINKRCEMPRTSGQQTSILLRHDEEGHVRIEDKDGDVFLMTVDAVIRACKENPRVVDAGKQVARLGQKLTN